MEVLFGLDEDYSLDERACVVVLFLCFDVDDEI